MARRSLVKRRAPGNVKCLGGLKGSSGLDRRGQAGGVYNKHNNNTDNVNTNITRKKRPQCWCFGRHGDTAMIGAPPRPKAGPRPGQCPRGIPAVGGHSRGAFRKPPRRGRECLRWSLAGQTWLLGYLGLSFSNISLSLDRMTWCTTLPLPLPLRPRGTPEYPTSSVMQCTPGRPFASTRLRFMYVRAALNKAFGPALRVKIGT